MGWNYLFDRKRWSDSLDEEVGTPAPPPPPPPPPPYSSCLTAYDWDGTFTFGAVTLAETGDYTWFSVLTDGEANVAVSGDDFDGQEVTVFEFCGGDPVNGGAVGSFAFYSSGESPVLLAVATVGAAGDLTFSSTVPPPPPAATNVSRATAQEMFTDGTPAHYPGEGTTALWFKITSPNPSDNTLYVNGTGGLTVNVYTFDDPTLTLVGTTGTNTTLAVPTTLPLYVSVAVTPSSTVNFGMFTGFDGGGGGGEG